MREAINLVLFRAGRLYTEEAKYLNRYGLCGELTSVVEKYGSCKGRRINGYVEFKDGTWFYHTWYELDDGRIWDLSASQFNLKGYSMPDEYLGLRPENYKIERPSGKIFCFTDDHFIEHYLYGTTF
jgi:hypothetical protein